MNFYEIMFILQFFGIIAIIGYRLWFVMSLGQTYDIRMTWLLFAGFFLPYIVGFIIFMTNPEILIYRMLFLLETWLVPLNVLFLLIELIFHLGVNGKQKSIKPYRSIDYQQKPYMR